MDQNRIDSFDKIRVTASILNVLLHVLVPFMVYNTGMWPFSYGNSKIILPDVIVFIIHNSNMNIFFFMSGFFSVFLLNKCQNLETFILNRVKKIIIPFIIAWLLLIPIILISFPIAKDIQNSNLQFDFNEWIKQAIYLFVQYKVPTAHLWFMFYWCIYFLIFIILNSYSKTKNLIQKLSTFLKPEGLIIILIVLSFGCRMYTSDSIILNPLSIIPELASLLFYLLYFITGYFSYYWLLNNVQLKLKPNHIFLFSILSTSVTLLCLHLFKQSIYNSMHLKLVLVLFSTLSSISNSISIILLSKRIKSTLIPVMLLKSTYWIYLLHIPVLMIFQILILYFNFTFFTSLILSISIPYAVCLWFYSIFGNKLMRL